ncbi:hypothetical protein [Flavobacterium sp.]|uniref:hypothetical protein n=1 Tax=Flavobacterium sp. TaxID=239 RepID=UPI0008D3EB76|nr:hypothetical protein [Flavobacterium sp.]OGS63303.1 MAG: hypothetical protein A2X07_04535 [Flavobacteria bacterium GWF1_32_7]HBD27275.1 hypothetical protein [Flavobacterium sp.]
MHQNFKGVFLRPSIFFIGDISTIHNYNKPFWDEIGNVLDVVAIIEYEYKGVIVNINIHRISFFSISDEELNKISTLPSINEVDIDKLAYYIFYSFSGMLDFYFITNEDLPNRIPIESFSCDENKKIHRQDASERFMYAQMIDDYYETPIEKAMTLSQVLKNSWSSMKIDKFLLTIEKQKIEKKFYNFNEEYYFLISSLDKNRYLAYNEGILITGWTICEYLINFMFGINVTEDLKNERKNHFNNIAKFPFAFDSKEKLRGYSDLINKAECSAEHKLEILKKEGKFNSSELYSDLIKLRSKRNVFIHDPAKNSLEIIKEDHLKLGSSISQYISELKEVIKEIKQ